MNKKSSKRLKVIDWLSRRARLDLDQDRHELQKTLSSLEAGNLAHSRALKAAEDQLAVLRKQVQAGQTLNLAIYQSGTLHVEQSLSAVAQTRAEVERIEAKAAAERDAMMRRRIRLQKLGERSQDERRELSAAARSLEQQQLDELWLNGRGNGGG
jgi:hypothetical protein